MPRIRLGREADGSFVVDWWPPELHPFGLRHRWWTMVAHDLEDGDPRKVVEWRAGAPETIPPDPFVEWTRLHQNALDENSYAFWRYAEQLRDGRIRAAIETRIETLELDVGRYKRVPPAELPTSYLVALRRRVDELRANGWTVVEIGERRKVDDLGLRTLNRRLSEEKRRRASLARASRRSPPALTD